MLFLLLLQVPLSYYARSMVNAKPCPGLKQKMYLNVVCLKKKDAKISIPPEMIADSEFEDFKMFGIFCSTFIPGCLQVLEIQPVKFIHQ
jgi:hypothetical protein